VGRGGEGGGGKDGPAGAEESGLRKGAAGGDGGEEGGAGWDILVADCVDPGGMLRQGVLEDVRLASHLILSQGGIVVPSQLTVRAMCVQSEQLLGENSVRPAAQGGIDVTLLNSYSVRSLMSLDLAHVALKTITEPADVMVLDLVALSPEYQYEFEWVAVEEGRIDAIAYWFRITWFEGSEHTETLPPLASFPGTTHGQEVDVQEEDACPPHWRQVCLSHTLTCVCVCVCYESNGVDMEADACPQHWCYVCCSLSVLPSRLTPACLCLCLCLCMFVCVSL
jgi:hypothetical protein